MVVVTVLVSVDVCELVAVDDTVVLGVDVPVELRVVVPVDDPVVVGVESWHPANDPSAVDRTARPSIDTAWSQLLPASR